MKHCNLLSLYQDCIASYYVSQVSQISKSSMMMNGVPDGVNFHIACFLLYSEGSTVSQNWKKDSSIILTNLLYFVAMHMKILICLMIFTHLLSIISLSVSLGFYPTIFLKGLSGLKRPLHEDKNNGYDVIYDIGESVKWKKNTFPSPSQQNFTIYKISSRFTMFVSEAETSYLKM